MDMIRHVSTIGRKGAGSVAGVAALCAMLVAGTGRAQETPASVPAPGAPAPSGDQAAPGFKPGFIDAFGRFIDDSAAKLNSQLKGANDALGTQLKNANDALGSGLKGANQTLGDIGAQTGETAKGAVGAARDAAGTIIGLPNTRIVAGRERCAEAANGAPDCRAAADAACRSKGFASGRMLDTQSERTCPVGALLSGRIPSKADCTQETFVTRSICQ
jgi:hypothetical protein